MKPKWIIEDFAPDNSFGALADEVKRQGMECELIQYLPFQSGSYDIYDEKDCVIFQGSINLAQQLQRDKKWIPGMWLTPKNYECTKYYAHLGKYLFNSLYVMMPRAEVKRRMDWLYNECFGPYEQLFIRPNSGLKPFTAGLCSRLNFDYFWRWVDDFTEPESIIVVSTPKVVKQEWRFICTKDGVLTGCQYEKSREFKTHPGYPEKAGALAAEVAATYQPDPIFVVDICLGETDNYYLMEIGSFSVAGLYACNMQPIVGRASEIALKEWEEENE